MSTFNEDDIIDRAILDYEVIYLRVLSLAPTIRPFIDYVRKIKPPQKMECQTLLPKAVEGDSRAIHRIVEMYLRGVIRIALNHSEKYKIPIEDTIQNGVTGLITAIEKYDSKIHNHFSTYYPLWVRQAIQREMPVHLYTRYVPIHTHEKFLVIKDLGMEHGLDLPTDYDLVDEYLLEQISQRLEVPFDTVDKYMRYFVSEFSLDEYLDEMEEPETLQDEVLTYDDCDDWINQIQNQTRQQAVEKALRSLTLREERLVRLRYGFIDGNPHTLDEVGQLLNITGGRVRQIECKAIRKLRHFLISRNLKNTCQID